MTKPDKIGQPDGLSMEQMNAIDLLILGKTDAEVGETVGVTRQTVNGWHNHHAAFVAELNQRRQTIWGAQVERLRGLVGDSVNVLAGNLESDDEKLSQAAAVHVLRCVGLYGTSLAPIGEINSEKLEREWARQSELEALFSIF